ncbi:MAG: HIT domain-containing protein [Chitinispirillales bacterium]|jgi:ATP adenylyltransferase|nr:HIT domain-containing protein [Chitinispirillales bacterium]
MKKEKDPPKHLWAPWRMSYIAGIDNKKDDGCIFCSKPGQDRGCDKENLLLYRGKTCFVLMNLFPYNNGHLMVIPYKHTSDILDIDCEASAELWNLVCRSKRALDSVMHPDGFNIGMNLGRTAGAGIDQHIHMHIVPRWNGDTNFMPVIGETKVISQALSDTYEALSPHFNN